MEIKMKSALLLSVLLALAPLGAAAADQEKTYWLLSQNGGKSWCAYADGAEYKRAVAVQQPAETARVITFGGDVVELEYQVASAGGDWIVMDKYGYTDAKLVLRRTNLLLQEGL